MASQGQARAAKLGGQLVKAGLIDEMQLRSALANADQWGLRLGKTLVRMRIVHEREVVKAIADATGFQAIDLSVNPPEPAATSLLDLQFCCDRGVFPLALREKAGARTLFLAMADPTDVETIDLVAARCRGRVKPFVASEQLIEKAVDKFHRGNDVRLELIEESTIEEIDEVKLVDVSGHTMTGVKAPVINLKTDAAPSLLGGSQSPAQRMAQRYASGAAAPPPPVPSTLPAADPLDFLGRSPAPAEGASPLAARLAAVEQQLQTVLKAQETSTSLVRALVELLIEKRYVTADEVRARASRR